MMNTAAKISISPDHTTTLYSLPIAPIPVTPNITCTSLGVLHTTDHHSQSKLTIIFLAQWCKPPLSCSPGNTFLLSLLTPHDCKHEPL